MKEDDGKWPQKNKDGRQELEIRLGNEHISFEVHIFPGLEASPGSDLKQELIRNRTTFRQQRSAP